MPLGCRRLCPLLAAAAALAALSACGGSSPPPRTDAKPKHSWSASTRARAQLNSHEAALVGYRQVESLAPPAPGEPPPPKLDERRARCTVVTEAVFYAANDWMRLARTLAAEAFPCAAYSISIPPVPAPDGTFTQPRPGQAGRLAALGSRFHALAEIRVTAWQQWLERNPGRTWYEAGREARRRLEAAGYGGETWAVNELMIPLLTDPGARRDMRELVRGLYEGGSGPARGVVFAVVPFQNARDVPEYKEELERWLQDSSFWAEMERTVRVWADEVYVDSRSCCVGGAGLAARADRLNEYLQHRLLLAEAGPESVAVARSFLRRAYLPLANGAWEWDFGFGNTVLAPEQMEQLVSEQAYAMRRFSAERRYGEAQSRVGFAWAPRNPNGTTGEAFAAATARVLARLSAALHDSARAGTAEAACGPAGRRSFCDCAVPGAAFTDAWAAFSSWD